MAHSPEWPHGPIGCRTCGNQVEFAMVNGNPFPLFDGAPLSWSIGLYNTLAEEQAGFPKARTVIRAMRERRPDQLEKEHASYLRASFDRMFGRNAKKMLALIEEEVPDIGQRFQKLDDYLRNG